MSKPYPTDILSKLRTSIESWKAIDANLKFGDLTLNNMYSVLERGQSLRDQISALEIQLTDLRNQRDEAYSLGWKYILRLRNGIKGIYGDDSTEYEMTGMKSRSKHKPRSRQVKSKTS
ncbi:MAG: hypothetical protein HGA30_02815 [Anaerolineales bacterium]|nr:hypothetical protein [Anaerolineales bacterium]